MSAEPARATRSPFPGLAAFGDGDDDAALFAGRDGEIDLVAANLRAARLTILYGPSGVGKSSLLHAGVVRRIREQAVGAAASGAPAPTIVLHDEWAGDPGAALAARIAEAAGVAGEKLKLDAAIERWCERRRGMLLLIFDQFEEYLRLHPEPGGDSLDELLPEIVEREDLRVHLLISLRDDALAELDRFEGRMPSLFDNYLRLPQMTARAAREAICTPVARVNEWRAAAGLPAVRLEDGLVDDVLEQLGGTRLSSFDAPAGPAADGRASRGADGSIEPAFLQLVMRRLWERDAAREPGRLRRATFTALGGAQAIVGGHLDEAMRTLSSGQRDVAAAVFGYLVTPSGAKIRYTADDLGDYAERPAPQVADVLTALSRPELRIIRRVPAPSGDPDRQGYEIFHDALSGAVRSWAQRRTAERLARRSARLAASLAAVLAISVALLAHGAESGALSRLDLRTVDARFALRGSHAPDPRILIVSRDRAHGTRADHARVLDAIGAGHPDVIADALEVEDGPDPNNPATRGTPALKRAVRRTSSRILLATSRIDDQGRTTLFGDRTPETSYYGAPVAYAGFPLDIDDVVRRAIAEVRADVAGDSQSATALRSLAAAAARRAGGIPDGGEFPAFIDFAGPPGTYRAVSFGEVLARTFDADRVRDRIVVIGDMSERSHMTAADRSKPMSPPELQANAIATMRAGLPLREAPAWLTYALIAALALAASTLALRRAAPVALALSAALGVLVLVAAQLAFEAGWLLAVVPSLLALATAALANPLVRAIVRARRLLADRVGPSLSRAPRRLSLPRSHR